MGAMGWVSMILFGSIYYVTTTLNETEIYSVKLANAHFWLVLVGQLIYSITMWIAGFQQGSMLLATNPDGTLHYSFMETMISVFPYYKIRAVSGFIYLAGLILFIYNIYKTFQKGSEIQSAKA
jgi:cytochrome c oxidase cbb3-type subunit 1